ncbi:restriction endonuclease [Brevundimonas sp. BAL450]|uniref:nSTAND3 domain-containing NTPase n=1 Tax=Brevundimonas sp. BAL450 TaxID=1708162 RepID=UPI0018CA8E71|nr:restriction endonuclease [Brevundimonas sp. BAL450]MBG7614653.1 restriction endonuclease [Brevundimonas sp. BAL450]
MTYDFKNLSAPDFEDLVRDLIGKELSVRFEAFCVGPDGGIDGRHANAQGNIILQAKHYEGSPYSKLKSAMKRERKSIDTLAPDRYVLATSCKLSPPSKAELATIIGPSLLSQSDIFGPEDLNGLLRRYPDILKSHIKLWLSGTGVLDRMLRSAAHAYAAITREDIEQKVRVYAPNPSFDQSLTKLEKHHVLIISGPPGVGKTTLAEMLSYAYLSEDWELVPIRSLDDGFAAINDTKQQIFLFDDFLGRVALDKQALSHKDSDLARFMSRVRRSKNARFILTTRGYIFEEARRVSEHLGDDRLDVTKYVLDVGIYTRRIKARILYNHLDVSETPKTHIRALVESSSLATIIDHKNYNPRVIEAMTDAFRVSEIGASEYPDVFLQALEDPTQIWDTAFRTHIDNRCRNLLFAMFFASEYAVSIGELRAQYDALHSLMSSAYSTPYGPKDFEDALRILEGSFVTISGQMVSYVNPSLRDYLSKYLSDADLLVRLAPSATSIDWIRSLWSHAEEKFLFDQSDQKKIAVACVGLIDMVETRPHWKAKPNDPRTLQYHDAPHSSRLTLLMAWWQATDDVRFADAIMNLAASPGSFGAWSDGSTLVGLFARLKDRGYGRQFVYEEEFLAAVERAVIHSIRYTSSDMLANFIEAIDEAGPGVPQSISAALEEAALAEFEDNYSRVSDEDSESSLTDRIDALKKLAPRYSIPDDVLGSAISTVEDRIAELSDQTSSGASTPSFTPRRTLTEKFDNNDLNNLFAPLLED